MAPLRVPFRFRVARRAIADRAPGEGRWIRFFGRSRPMVAESPGQGEVIVRDLPRGGDDAFGVHRGEVPRESVAANDHQWWLITGAVGLLIIGLLITGLMVEQVRLAQLWPRMRIDVELALAMARLFSALVLFLLPWDATRERLHWVAAGFLILGVGDLVFGYLPSVLGLDPSLNTYIYGSLAMRTASGLLFVIGLIPRTPPRFSLLPGLLAALAVGALFVAISWGASHLPRLVDDARLVLYVADSSAVPPGLTAWYRALSVLPLVVALAAMAGTAIRFRDRTLGVWLLMAMALLTSAQLHALVWPPTNTAVLSGADVLRFSFAAIVAVGCILELRRIAAERAALLAAQREASRRLVEQNMLRSNFTAMVAHELTSPLAAIRHFTTMLETRELGASDQAQVLAAIQSESEVLTGLVCDMQTAAMSEARDFVVRPRRVRLSQILSDAAVFGTTLSGGHPVTVPLTVSDMVWADAERIGQVLRNLLTNAAKYSPPGTPIDIRVVHAGVRVRVEVVDSGPGIDPHDLRRVFDKFGRGRDRSGQKVPGVGLGLYLSRQIMRAHGSDLQVESTPGAGSTFAFELSTLP